MAVVKDVFGLVRDLFLQLSYLFTKFHEPCGSIFGAPPSHSLWVFFLGLKSLYFWNQRNSYRYHVWVLSSFPRWQKNPVSEIFHNLRRNHRNPPPLNLIPLIPSPHELIRERTPPWECFPQFLALIYLSQEHKCHCADHCRILSHSTILVMRLLYLTAHVPRDLINSDWDWSDLIHSKVPM